MENKQLLAESIAEDLVFNLKTMFPTDLTYQFIDEETHVVELKYTPKGKILKSKFVNTLLKYLENES